MRKDSWTGTREEFDALLERERRIGGGDVGGNLLTLAEHPAARPRIVAAAMMSQFTVLLRNFGIGSGMGDTRADSLMLVNWARVVGCALHNHHDVMLIDDEEAAGPLLRRMCLVLLSDLETLRVPASWCPGHEEGRPFLGGRWTWICEAAARVVGIDPIYGIPSRTTSEGVVVAVVLSP